MGEQFSKEQVNYDLLELFQSRVNSQLEQLKAIVTQPSFDQNKYSFGAELELYLTDTDTGLPSARNLELLEKVNNPQLQPELNQFNIEFNSSPVDCSPDALVKIETEFRDALTDIQQSASELGIKIAPIGILPTLTTEHLNIGYMTDIPRYHTLAETLLSHREGTPFHININGNESLEFESSDVTTEGACTSLQVHLRVPVSKFADVFNAAQITTPLVMALAANSPILAERKLWHETRVPLFKQSIDCRLKSECDWRQPSRVTFGHGYLRQYPWEQFAENVALFDPLFPVLFDDSSTHLSSAHQIPKLKELCLHHGTVWSWNRSVYSHLDGGHMRIEFRSIPAGPTVDDMMANMALAIGWAIGLAKNVEEYLYPVPFRFSEYNFYRCAEHSLQAKILWPQKSCERSIEQPVTHVIESLLPVAIEGLTQLGINHETIVKTMNNIRQRLSKQQNGAIWQLKQLEKLEEKFDRSQALSHLTQLYLDNAYNGIPVSDWNIKEI